MRDTFEAEICGARYSFRLLLPAAIDLERECASLGDDGAWRDHPLGDLAKQVASGSARVLHVAATVRAGLHSGADGVLPPMRISKIVAEFIAARPLIELAGTAHMVLVAALTTARLPTSSGKKATGRNQPLSRGDVLANCAAIGIDWQTLTVAAYAEVMTVQHQRNDPNYKPGMRPISDDLRSIMKKRIAIVSER